MKTEALHNMGEAYYADSASPLNLTGPVSKSLLWKFAASPNKWYYGKAGFTPTPAMELGTLLHTAILEPEKLDSNYVICPFDSYRTNEARAWKEDIEAQGKSVVKEAELSSARFAAETFWADPLLYHIQEGFATEVAYYAPLGNVQCKGLIDIVPNGGNSLVDLKTTASIESLDNLTKMVYSRGYHWQAAMYLDLYNAVTGENRDDFQIVFMESTYPFEIAVVNLSKKYIDLGRAGYMNALMKWQDCVAIEVFPPAIPCAIEIDPPNWAK